MPPGAGHVDVIDGHWPRSSRASDRRVDRASRSAASRLPRSPRPCRSMRQSSARRGAAAARGHPVRDGRARTPPAMAGMPRYVVVRWIARNRSGPVSQEPTSATHRSPGPARMTICSRSTAARRSGDARRRAAVTSLVPIAATTASPAIPERRGPSQARQDRHRLQCTTPDMTGPRRPQATGSCGRTSCSPAHPAGRRPDHRSRVPPIVPSPQAPRRHVVRYVAGRLDREDRRQEAEDQQHREGDHRPDPDGGEGDLAHRCVHVR